MKTMRRLVRVLCLAAVGVVVCAGPAHAFVTTPMHLYADGYEVTHQSGDFTLDGAHQWVGQSFTGGVGTLSVADVFLAKSGSPDRNVIAAVYPHTGTYGSTSRPTGSPIDVAAPVAASSLTDSTQPVHFVFGDDVSLTPGARYVLVLYYVGDASPNGVRAAIDGTAPTHPGNLCWVSAAIWTANSAMDLCFRVYTTEPVYAPVWRFYRPSTGTHFYTSDASEYVTVRDTMTSIYALDGVAYSRNIWNASNAVPLWRFFNLRTGAHLYTADVAEKDSIVQNLSGTYSLDGVAYNVSLTGGKAVHRFYSAKKGVHFYSADPAEIDYVKQNLASVWQYEGLAYYVGQ